MSLRSVQRSRVLPCALIALINTISVVEHPTSCVSVLSVNSDCMLIYAFIRAFFARFVNGMVYYGVSFSAPFVGGNMYLNFFITSTIALVAYPALAWGCNR